MGGDEDEFWRSLLAFDYKMCFFFLGGGELYCMKFVYIIYSISMEI